MIREAKILIVDDEKYVTIFVHIILEVAGYDVEIANSGAAALELFTRETPDIVLLDVKMPEMDGYQVLKRIREKSNVPVLMLTAVRDQSALARSLELGADDYITKPFSSEVLKARIQAKLKRARGEGVSFNSTDNSSPRT